MQSLSLLREDFFNRSPEKNPQVAIMNLFLDIDI